MAKGLRPWQPGNIHTLDEYKILKTTNVNSATHLELVERFRACMEQDRKGREESEKIQEESRVLLKETDQWLQENKNKVQKVTKNEYYSGNNKHCFRVSAVAGVAILIMILILLKHRDQQSLLNRGMR
jgi:hypothetical protein